MIPNKFDFYNNISWICQKIEISLIREALDISDWVVARSAKMLNLQRTTLVEKMRKYSIDRVPHASEI